MAQPTTTVYNVAKAGSSIPIKFSLHGNQGLAIFAAGYPLSQQILAAESYTDSTITMTTNASDRSGCSAANVAATAPPHE